MNPFALVRAIFANFRQRAIQSILSLRVRARHPTLRADPTVIWDYGFHDLDAFEIGRDVVIMTYSTILLYKKATLSPREGRLILRDRVIFGTHCNVRAAGGTIEIGEGTGISHYCLLVAAEHRTDVRGAYLHREWSDTKYGITIGKNVFVGGHSVILPGSVIGDNAVIAAGAIVRGEVPPNELWGGVPARKIKDL